MMLSWEWSPNTHWLGRLKYINSLKITTYYKIIVVGDGQNAGERGWWKYQGEEWKWVGSYAVDDACGCAV